MIGIQTCQILTTLATLNLGSWSMVIVENLQQFLRPHCHPTWYNVKFGTEIKWFGLEVHIIHILTCHMWIVSCKFTFNKHGKRLKWIEHN
jgi:hypothetical protein